MSIFTTHFQGKADPNTAPRRGFFAGLREKFMGIAGNGKGLDDWIQNNNGKVAMAGAAALAFADGDDGLIWGAAELAIDTWAINSVASGNPSIIAKLWMAKRAVNVLPEDAGWITSMTTAVATFMGMNEWDKNWDDAPEQEASFNVPFVPCI